MDAGFYAFGAKFTMDAVTGPRCRESGRLEATFILTITCIVLYHPILSAPSSSRVSGQGAT